MSAHSRPMQLVCWYHGCSTPATEEVFNTYNATQGKYCKKHAADRVKILQAGEAVTPSAAAGARRREK